MVRTRFLGAAAQDIIKLGNEPLPIADMLAGSAAERADSQYSSPSLQKTR